MKTYENWSLISAQKGFLASSHSIRAQKMWRSEPLQKSTDCVINPTTTLLSSSIAANLENVGALVARKSFGPERIVSLNPYPGLQDRSESQTDWVKRDPPQSNPTFGCDPHDVTRCLVNGSDHPSIPIASMLEVLKLAQICIFMFVRVCNE